jgi:heat shock protein HtpX
LYSQIAANKRKTILMMAVFFVFVAGLAYLFAGYLGGRLPLFYGILVFEIIYIIVTYYAGSRLSLAVNGAKEIKKKDNPRLWRTVENIAITDGLPMPRVFIMHDPAPNAFATGRKPEKAAVCATSGLLKIMDDSELEGVIAHEMGHVKNYDIRVSMLAFALAAVVSLIADIILYMTWFRGGDRENGSPIFLIAGIAAAILAPLIASLIQLAISRKREFLADATGALTTRYPEGLASALAKLEHVSTATRKQNSSTAHLFFANPLKGKGLSNLFSTHPPLQERIKRLKEMGGEA